MPDIFDEVEEDLRAERARRVLRRYGVWLVGAAVLVVLAVAGFEVWSSYQAGRRAEVAARYIAASAVADGRPGPARDAAAASLAGVARDGGAGYRALARLRQAALLAGRDDLGGADALWDQVAGDPGADPVLRDVANLQWGLHNIDAGDPAAVAARLKPLAAETSPWHGLAAEGQALLALRQGQTDQARDLLGFLVQDTAVPEGVRRRAGGLLEQLGPKGRSTS